MRFLLSGEQRAFAASLDELLTGVGVAGVARDRAAGRFGPGRALWSALAELGVSALAVPERWEGLGAHPADLVVAFDRLGRHGVPGPVVESMAFVPALLADSPGLAEAWLPRLASGSAVATAAVTPHAPYAPDADLADLVLLADLPGGTARFAGIAEGPLVSVDRTRRLFALKAGEVFGPAPVRAAFDLGVLACSAYLLGAGTALLAASTEHAKRRVQFGHPVGRFQAVKHRLADVYIGLELAGPLLYGAAVSIADGAPTAGRDVAAAKVACGDAAYRAARAALQVHGAIGYTAEHDLGRLITAVRALVSAWGTPSAHRAAIMAALETAP